MYLIVKKQFFTESASIMSSSNFDLKAVFSSFYYLKTFLISVWLLISVGFLANIPAADELVENDDARPANGC